MKRLTTVFLLLSLCLLCIGCSAEQSSSAEPQIRYEDSTAYYTQNGAKYTMDLAFTDTVEKGSTIALLLDGKEILGFTAEEDFSHLRLSSVLLELNQPYHLTVNGKLQRHGKGRPIAETTPPGYIPDPTMPTIPQEPMGEVVTTAPSSQDNENNDSPFGTPPTIVIEEIPSFEDATSSVSNGILPSQPFGSGKTQSEDSSLLTDVSMGGTEFTLTSTITGFVSVQNNS